MPERDITPVSERRLRWLTITGPMAWCDRCPSPGWAYHGDRDRSARKAINAARRHARETGHEVIVERGQSIRVRAPANGSTEER